MSALNLIQSIFGANMGGQNPLYQQQARMRGMPQVFKRKYHAYSPAYWNSENRDKLEAGDKIVLPASALEELSRMNISFPIMFEIAHDSTILPTKSHCSVLEFTAPEGSVYLPIWMIDNLGLDPQGESVVELTTINLPKGQFVQFQAHETEFAMLSNPRVVLEKNLRSYSCLTIGDTIQIEFANHIYKLDVTEVKPYQPRGTAPAAISIIETDIKVDFKEPRDYKEWEKKNHSQNFNGSPKKSNEKKEDILEEEEDDFGSIKAPKQSTANDKSTHFKSLEESGYSGFKAKKENKKNKNVLASTPQKLYKQNSLGDTPNPYSSRGSPLGKKNKISPTSGGGKCEYKKPKYVNGNYAMGHLIKQKSVRKEEEIVGTMRYIYEIDEHGNRNLVRRLPVRSNAMYTDKTKGHSLKK